MALFGAWQAQATTGPTLRLAAPGSDVTIPLADFMYFVPLISPEPVSTLTSAGNRPAARMISASRHFAGAAFSAEAEFSFSGAGSEQNIIDLTRLIRRNEGRLKNGATLEHVLKSIVVDGRGRIKIEVEGVVSNNVPTVTEVRIHFNQEGEESPVTISLCDIRWADGQVRPSNEVIARVNTLTFRRTASAPKMEVGLASVKDKAASDSLWQNFKGRVKGIAANMLIPPLPVETVGNVAMLDFGLALASRAPTFTFPHADNLISVRKQ